jgi:C4-dicarboxylate transporter DctM subunit
MNWALEFMLFGGVLLALLVVGMWIPFAIGIAAVFAIWLSSGVDGLRAIGMISWASTNSFTLTSVPMFILMAEIVLRSGVSTRCYTGLGRVVRGLPGGLLQTNIVGCALFSAISGSSVATAAAIGTAALPQLDARKYDRRMAAGSLAAGGTLGILIPPSVAMILYGTFTETSVARLFMAGLVPGLLLTGIFMAYIAVVSIARPGVAPADDHDAAPGDRLRGLLELLPFMVLILAVLGSLYAGFATPTEAAAVGCTLALAISAIWGQVTFRVLNEAIGNTVRISATIMLIVLMAYVFSYAVELAGLSHALTEWFIGLKMNRYVFLAVLVAIYCVLGCLLDSIGLIVLTVPLLFGPVQAYGFDPIWFGVVLVLLLELGQITPPIGLNLFVVQGISNWRLGDVIAGTAPYWVILILFVALLAAVPEIALWLPERMFERR